MALVYDSFARREVDRNSPPLGPSLVGHRPAPPSPPRQCRRPTGTDPTLPIAMTTATSSLASNSLDNLDLPVMCGNDADKNQLMLTAAL